MTQLFNKTILSMAIAIFSMFFGAGNAVFPLLLGLKTQGNFSFAFLGLLLTGIGGPLLGLLGATLFHGRFLPFFEEALNNSFIKSPRNFSEKSHFFNSITLKGRLVSKSTISCKNSAWISNKAIVLNFLKRARRIPGYLLIGVTLALLGPLAVLPRCVTVAYAAINPLFSSPLWLFALLFCAIALFCCWRRRFLVPVLGYILSPLLIGCLLLIIYQGLSSDIPLSPSSLSNWSAFRQGVTTGYDTMDLIASIYFSAGIWTMIELQGRKKPQEVFKITLKAGLLGCLLLAAIYLGLTHAAARFSPFLQETSPEQLMPHLAHLTLGPTLGLVANLAIALACLTTVISLTMTIGDIVTKELLPNRLSYRPIVILILLITTVMANFGFNAIMKLLHPLVSICYPLIIALTVVNIFHKLSLKSQPYRST